MPHDNLILMTDSYKVGHWPQYPAGTENVFSYFESRGGSYPETVFFGLQYILEKYLTQHIMAIDIMEAEEMFAAHFGSPKMFNKAGWKEILYRHRGTLPVRIKAVPEGTVVPTGNVLMTVENTDPTMPWLTNYLETLLSQVWYPTTVATISYEVRKVILAALEKSGDPSLIDFKLHDFGFRGVSSYESAMIGGAAHLTSFMGTDTFPAASMLKKYYKSDMAGFSVPASEHSTMTSWGREHEVDAFRNMIQTYGDMPFYSVVSDSYDIFEACKELWGTQLKDEVLAANGTLVVRPDSGNPRDTTLKVLDILGEKFGTITNEKRYKVLNPKVRVIWGDGLEPNTIRSILDGMLMWGWSADNITFGMGGGLLQKVNRDTQKFAFKCSSVTVHGYQHDVWKQPVGQSMKISKKGRLELFQFLDRSYQTLPEDSITAGGIPLLQTVFENGRMVKRHTLDEIRERIRT